MSWITWRSLKATSFGFICMITFDNWGLHDIKVVFLWCPISFRDYIPRHLIDSLGSSKASSFDIILRSLLTCSFIMNSLLTDFFKTIFASIIRPLWSIWIIWINWLTWFAWFIWGNGLSTMNKVNPKVISTCIP